MIVNKRVVQMDLFDGWCIKGSDYSVTTGEAYFVLYERYSKWTTDSRDAYVFPTKAEAQFILEGLR